MKKSPLRLKKALMSLVAEFGDVTVENGIVTVTCPDGSVWDFTEPMMVKVGKILLELVRAAKEKKIDVLVVHHPEVLGDDYDELVLNLNLVSEAELLLSIVPPKQRGG